MLRGLPFSNVLGLWSGHSCSSSPGSGPPGSSCPWVSSYSSGPTSFSCEPEWCMCVHEWSARCPGCNAYASGYQMIMTWCIDDIGGYIYKVVNIIQEHVLKLSIYCILFYKLLSWLTNKLTWCFKDTPNIPLFHLIYAQQIIIYFNYYWTYNISIYFWLSINSTEITVDH